MGHPLLRMGHPPAVAQMGVPFGIEVTGLPEYVGARCVREGRMLGAAEFRLGRNLLS